MYYKLPQRARKELVYNFVVNPMTLTVCMVEVKNNTNLGIEILQRLGYEDDEYVDDVDDVDVDVE